MRQRLGSPLPVLRSGEGVTLAGILVNLALVLVKISAGVLGRSSALVADALHSLSDLASDVVVLFGYRVGRMPEDADHPYGHGKIETLSTALVGVILVAAGAGMAWSALTTLRQPQALIPPSAIALGAALLSVVAKEALYRWTAAVARDQDSRLLLANAWHHRSDALSSLVTLAGIAGARWGAPWLDPAAALLVCAFVGYVGWDLAWQALKDLTDTTVDRDLEEAIAAAVASVPGVRAHHSLKTRRVGRDVLVDVDVEVDPALNVIQGHDIARAVRSSLLRKVRGVRDVMVHVEPLGARQGEPHAPRRPEDLAREVEVVIQSVAGVRGTDGIRVLPTPEGYLVTLSVKVDSVLTLTQAHRIAQRAERRIGGLPGVAAAVVQLDPEAN